MAARGCLHLRCPLIFALGLQRILWGSRGAVWFYVSARRPRRRGCARNGRCFGGHVSDKPYTSGIFAGRLRGKCMPDCGIIQKFCDALYVTLSELMDGKDAAQDSVRA